MARRRQEEEESSDVSGSEESEEESSESASDAGSDSGDEETEEDEEDEENEDEEVDDGEPKHKLVEADLIEIRKMMEEMDKIKMRLQFRLAREQGGSSSNGSSRRRSSVEDIYVPPTISAAVQTTWDMSHMCEVEKVVMSKDVKSMTSHQEAQTRPILPVSKSAQLSIQDLARSYGIKDAFATAESSHRLPSPTRASPPAPPQMTGQVDRTPMPSTAKPDSNTSLWDGLEMHSPASTSHELPRPSPDKSLMLEVSQLVSDSGVPVPVRDSFVDSFGSPVSPTSDTIQGASVNPSHDEETKTIEQKEMEAVRGLLFF